MKYKIVIIGAGIAGLSLGYFLKQNNFNDFLIVESASKPGGLLKKFELNGQKFNIGLKNIRFKSDTVIQLLKDLDIRFETINHDGRYFFWNHQFLETPVEKHFKINKVKRECWSLQDFINSYDNQDLIQLLQGYSEKSYKYNLNWIYHKTSNKILINEQQPEAIKADTEELVEKLYEKLTNNVWLNQQLKFIDLKNKFIILNDTDNTQIEYDLLIPTIPLPYIIKACTKVPDIIKEAFFLINYTNLFLVFAVSNMPIFNTRYRSIYYSQKELLFHRLNIESEYAVCAEINFSKEKFYLLNSEGYKQLLIKKVLHQINNLFSSDITKAEALIVSVGSLISDLNYPKISEIIEWLKVNGVYCFGRYAEWSDILIHETIERAKTYAPDFIKLSQEVTA